MPPEKFAAQAIAAIDAGTSYRVIPRQAGAIAKTLRLMPNWLYDFLFSHAPHKARATPD
jgi:short-subunit dehydrogenase